MGNWLSPINKLKIQTAVRKKAKRVILDDGRGFDLSYLRHNKEDQVRLAPTDGKLSPQGYFNVDKIIDPFWVSDTGDK